MKEENPKDRLEEVSLKVRRSISYSIINIGLVKSGNAS